MKEDEVGLEIVSVDGMQVDRGYISVQYDLGYIRGDEAETCQGKTDRCITLEKHSVHSGRGAQLDYRYVLHHRLFVSTTTLIYTTHSLHTMSLYFFFEFLKI